MVTVVAVVTEVAMVATTMMVVLGHVSNQGAGVRYLASVPCTAVLTVVVPLVPAWLHAVPRYLARYSSASLRVPTRIS